MDHEVGSLVEGKVVDIVKFGAFVKIRGGKTGLVHISQISDKFVREVSDYISVGAEVIAKVISIDDKGRVQLSLKDVAEEEQEKFQKSLEERQNRPDYQEQEYRDERSHSRPGHKEENNFEAKFKKFMRQSEDRLIDLKRNTESKRPGGKRRK